jgi:hypothetical protein
MRSIWVVLTGLDVHLSEADPDLASEGSLDPLGLATLADRLAEEIAPSVTARMTRIRFVTAMAVGAIVTDGLDDLPPGDGTSTAQLAYEWHVVEAIARDHTLPPAATLGVPGIAKTRSVLGRGGHLDAGAYLKAPKVFGFHGVFKRLARAFSVIDDELHLGRGGAELVGVWEREQELPGFVDRRPGGSGGRLARNLDAAVRAALVVGRITQASGSHLWSKLVRSLRPDGAGPAERALLWKWLVDPEVALRSELVLLLETLSVTDGSEAEVLRALRPSASRELRVRLDAINAFERLSELLQAAFDALRWVSTSQGTAAVSASAASGNRVVAEAAGTVPVAFAEAMEKLEPLDLAGGLVGELGGFAGIARPVDLVEVLLDHHDRVQRDKPPGKRPWVERDARGFLVRPAYRVEEEPALSGRYLHPFRVRAIHQFIRDLR